MFECSRVVSKARFKSVKALQIFVEVLNQDIHFCKTEDKICGKGNRGCEAFPEGIHFQATAEDRE